MTTNVTENTFVAPAAFLKGKGIKLTVGQLVDYTSLGLAPHPKHGPIPVVTVLEVRDDGSLLTGSITCACDKLVTVHAGDVFQKRRCETCQKVAIRERNRVEVDPAVAVAKAAEAKAKAELKVKVTEEKKAAAAEKKAAEKLFKAKKKAEEVVEEKLHLAENRAGKTAAELVKAAS